MVDCMQACGTTGAVQEEQSEKRRGRTRLYSRSIVGLADEASSDTMPEAITEKTLNVPGIKSTSLEFCWGYGPVSPTGIPSAIISIRQCHLNRTVNVT